MLYQLEETVPDSIAASASEMAATRAWREEHLTGAVWPCSFSLDGRRIASPEGWQVERNERALDAARHELTLTSRHPDHGLVVRCVAVCYRDFPVVEWTVHLEQTAEGAAPLVADLQGLDATWRLEPGQHLL